MLHLLSVSAFNALNHEKESLERKKRDDSHKSVFDRYSVTERFEDILNTLKAIYFKLEIAEKRKSQPDYNFIAQLSTERLFLADIQQRHMQSFSVKRMEELLEEQLIPELRKLQSKYPHI